MHYSHTSHIYTLGRARTRQRNTKVKIDVCVFSCLRSTTTGTYLPAVSVARHFTSHIHLTRHFECPTPSRRTMSLRINSVLAAVNRFRLRGRHLNIIDDIMSLASTCIHYTHADTSYVELWSRCGRPITVIPNRMQIQIIIKMDEKRLLPLHRSSNAIQTCMHFDCAPFHTHFSVLSTQVRNSPQCLSEDWSI